jgi:glycosyltransferase involved in cell wall biosynthesis
MNVMLNRIQRWDIEASKRVTHYIANAKLTQQRIADDYGRDSTIIHPPVDVDRFDNPREPEDYLLFVGEVVGHKRVETAIEAAQLAGMKIKVVGDGPERERLTTQYAGTVEFPGRVTDSELNELYSRCTALVVPNVEEFGIAAVEAQAAGRPVVAIDRGGTSETVVNGVTGVLVEHGDTAEFAEAIRETDFNRFDGEAIAAHAQQFSAERFRERILGLLQ